MEQRVKFYQQGPRLGNPFTEDASLQRFVKAVLAPFGSKVVEHVEQDLAAFGDKVAGPYVEMAENAEQFKPVLEQFNQWGQRVDRLHLSEGWKSFKAESATEGLVSIPYESDSPHARIHQCFKLAMFEPSSGMYGCPLAMTDGAAFAIRGILAEQKDHPDKAPKLAEKTLRELQGAFAHLTSRDPAKFWTSGQWFTEKQGGSDLARATQTMAKASDTPFATHTLSGYKWFTSAVDAEMTLTLASITDQDDPEMHRERKPLSLFFLQTRMHKDKIPAEVADDNTDVLNGIQVVRLKDKMATRQLPTAELVLEDADAHLLSEPGSGVKAVSGMLLITRLHNSLTACSYVLRMRNLAVDFAHQRQAFGKAIVDKPLHTQSLFEYDMDARGNLLMVVEMARLLGLRETGNSTPQEDAVLRILSSLAKVFTARDCVRLMSEGVELFGAVGVMQNHMSTLFRDASVLPIWEGTTNTLSLDLLRIAAREPEAIKALHDTLLEMAQDSAELKDNISKVFGYIAESAKDLDRFEWNARRLTMNLSRAFVAGVCAKMAAETGHDEDHLLFQHWLDRAVHEYEPMTDPKAFNTLRNALPAKMHGKARDDRGKLRSIL